MLQSEDGGTKPGNSILLVNMLLSLPPTAKQIYFAQRLNDFA